MTSTVVRVASQWHLPYLHSLSVSRTSSLQLRDTRTTERVELSRAKN